MDETTPSVETPAESAAPEPATEQPTTDQTTPEAMPETPEAQPAPENQKEPTPADPMDAPIADWSQIKLPAMDGIDLALVEDFGKTVAQATGMSQKQVEAAIKWQLNAIAKTQADNLASQTAALEKAWGAERKTNAQRVDALIQQVSKGPGLEGFAQALEASGATNNAVVIQGLFAIAKLLDEDGTKSGGAGAATPREQTALDGIEEAYQRAKSGKNRVA